MFEKFRKKQLNWKQCGRILERGELYGPWNGNSIGNNVHRPRGRDQCLWRQCRSRGPRRSNGSVAKVHTSTRPTFALQHRKTSIVRSAGIEIFRAGNLAVTFRHCFLVASRLQRTTSARNLIPGLWIEWISSSLMSIESCLKALSNVFWVRTDSVGRSAANLLWTTRWPNMASTPAAPLSFSLRPNASSLGRGRKSRNGGHSQSYRSVFVALKSDWKCESGELLKSTDLRRNASKSQLREFVTGRPSELCKWDSATLFCRMRTTSGIYWRDTSALRGRLIGLKVASSFKWHRRFPDLVRFSNGILSEIFQRNLASWSTRTLTPFA